MKLEAKVMRLGAVALCAMALVACGGGDDGPGTTITSGPSGGTSSGTSGGTSGGASGGTQPASSVVVGAVEASFVEGSDARFAAVGLDTRVGALGGAKQAANGTFPALSTYSTSSAAVGGIAGNASYAMGNWVGKVQDSDGNKEVSTPNGVSYAVFNRPAQAKADGTLTCTPHITSPRTARGKGETMAGTSTMTIADGVISVSANLVLTQVDGNATPVTFNHTFTMIGGTTFVGMMTSTPTRPIEYTLSIGDGVGDGHIVVMPWRLNAAAGVQHGMTVLECKRPV